MKLVAYVLGIALIVIAAVYLVLPGRRCRASFPATRAAGAYPLQARLLSGAIGVLLLAVGWFMGRR